MKPFELFLLIIKVPIDYVALVLAGLSAYFLRFSDWAVGIRPVMFDLSIGEYLQLVSIAALVWVVVFAFVGLYSPQPNKKFSKEFVRIIFGSMTALAILAVYLLFTTQQFDSRFLVAAGWGIALVYVTVARASIRGVRMVLARFGIGLRRVVVIGAESVTQAIVDALKYKRSLGYHVVLVAKHFDINTKKKLQGLSFDEILYTNPRGNEKEAVRALEFCHEQHKTFKYSADLFATYSTNMSVYPLAGVPVVELRRTRLEGWGRVVKWIFDYVLAIVVIGITSPIMVLTVLAILIESGRPILYKNTRVGKFGKHISVWKFRSMYQKYCTGVGNDEAESFEQDLIQTQNTKKGPVYKIADDPRVTRVGRFIRRWSIDELPQFFNVLSGDMSIIGPRPHQPREVEQYKKHHKHVLHIKPGVSGLSQISGRSDLTFEEEVRLDVLYMEKWSLLLDGIIFLKTPFTLFKKRKVE